MNCNYLDWRTMWWYLPIGSRYSVEVNRFASAVSVILHCLYWCAEKKLFTQSVSTLPPKTQSCVLRTVRTCLTLEMSIIFKLTIVNNVLIWKLINFLLLVNYFVFAFKFTVFVIPLLFLKHFRLCSIWF